MSSSTEKPNNPPRVYRLLEDLKVAHDDGSFARRLAQLAKARRVGVKLDRSHPVFVQINELLPDSPKFCPYPGLLAFGELLQGQGRNTPISELFRPSSEEESDLIGELLQGQGSKYANK